MLSDLVPDSLRQINLHQVQHWHHPQQEKKKSMPGCKTLITWKRSYLNNIKVQPWMRDWIDQAPTWKRALLSKESS
eukprot:12925155-Prorocentrum_lima.AAC.1